MLAAISVPLFEAAVAVAFVAGILLGLTAGWQTRGHHELGRRGNDVDLAGRRPTGPS